MTKTDSQGPKPGLHGLNNERINLYIKIGDFSDRQYVINRTYFRLIIVMAFSFLELCNNLPEAFNLTYPGTHFTTCHISLYDNNIVHLRAFE